MTGREGEWTKIKLTESISGWVIDTAVTVLPSGTTAPHSYVKQISTRRHGDSTTVIIGTSRRHPFKVEEDLAAGTITVSLFGVDSDTDWIRYDSRDPLIDQIQWLQPELGCIKYDNSPTNIWG
jgi:hypothetical protein